MTDEKKDRDEKSTKLETKSPSKPSSNKSPQKPPKRESFGSKKEIHEKTEEKRLTPPLEKSILSPPKKEQSETKVPVGKNLENVPVVVESPPRSPICQLPETSDSTSSTLFREKNRRNVCSFLSDIESEGYLSSFSLLNDDDSEDEKTITEDVSIRDSIVDDESLKLSSELKGNFLKQFFF